MDETLVKMKRWVRVRVATRKDAVWVHKLVGELAQHQRLTAAFVATIKELEDTLFSLPTYQGPTTFLLECTTTPSAFPLADDDGHETGMSSPIVHTQEIALSHEVDDDDAEAYQSGGLEQSVAVVVVGIVLFFPNYSTLVAKAGYYVEDLYIRAPFRGHGLGTVLLHTVAVQALRRGAERLEWCVLDCDEEAVRFYKDLGAAVLPDWRICRWSGRSLNHILDLQPSKP